MSFLLDTNVVSEPWKPQPEPAVIAWMAVNEWHIPAPVFSEIQEGAQRKGGSELERINRLLDQFPLALVLPWDGETARTWGRLWHSPETKRQPQSLWDSLIDAMGVRYGLKIVTRNTGDFRHSSTVNPWG